MYKLYPSGLISRYKLLRDYANVRRTDLNSDYSIELINVFTTD